MATITHNKNVCHTSGELPAVGSTAPNFRLVTADSRPCHRSVTNRLEPACNGDSK